MLVGNKINELRKEIGLTQEILAEKINVSRQTISNWETNQTIPDIYQAKKLSKVFDISIDDLLKDEKEEENEMLHKEIWDKVKEKIKEQISSLSYETWFEDISKGVIKQDKLIIYCKMSLICTRIISNYSELILKIINEISPQKINEVVAVLEKDNN